MGEIVVPFFLALLTTASCSIFKSESELAKFQSGCAPNKFENGRRTVRCSSLRQIPRDILDAERVQVLTFQHNNTLERLASGGFVELRMSSLNSIILKDCGISQIEHGAFIGLESVVELDLGQNKLEKLDPRVFSGLRRLTVLRLGQNPIIQWEIPSQFPSLPALSTLDISFGKLDFIPIGMLDKLPALKSVQLNSNLFKKIDWRVFRKTKQIERVNFSGNPLACDCTLGFLLDFLSESSVNLDQCSMTLNMATLGAKVLHLPCPPEVDSLGLSNYHTLDSIASLQENSSNAEDNRHIFPGQTVFLDCGYSGRPVPSIEWYKDGVLMDFAAFSTPTTGNTRPRVQIQKNIEFEPDASEYYEQRYGYHYRETLIIRQFNTEDQGYYTCIAKHNDNFQQKTIAAYMNENGDASELLQNSNEHHRASLFPKYETTIITCIILIGICLTFIFKGRNNMNVEAISSSITENTAV